MPVYTSGILDWGHRYGNAVYVEVLPLDFQLKRKRTGLLPEGFLCNPYHALAAQAFFQSSVMLETGGEAIPPVSGDSKVDGDPFERPGSREEMSITTCSNPPSPTLARGDHYIWLCEMCNAHPELDESQAYLEPSLGGGDFIDTDVRYTLRRASS